MKLQPGRARLPTIWVETGPLPSDPEGEMWALPNTQPLVNIDLRQPVYRAGQDPRLVTPSPQATAAYVSDEVRAWRDAFAPRFALYGKRLRIGFVVKGPDTEYGDTTLWLAKHPDDGGDPAYAVPLHIHGRDYMRAWSDSAWPVVRNRLVSDGLPLPELFLTDFESLFDSAFDAYRLDGHGWFEDIREAAREEAGLPNVSNYHMGGGVVLKDWLASRTTDLSGQPLPPYNFFVNNHRNHPVNNDLIAVPGALAEMSFLESLRYALAEPVKAAFGQEVLCGEWQLYCDSRLSRTVIKPFDKRRYFRYGLHAVDLQIPQNYGPDQYYIRDNQPDNEGWGTVNNWLKWFQLEGLAGSRAWRAFTEIHEGLARGSARAVGGHRLMPCTGLEASVPYTEELLQEVEDWFAGYLISCTRAGAKHVWMFAPGWNSGSPVVTVSEYRSHYLRVSRLVNAAALSAPRRRGTLCR
jgi:hypothetical protein